MSALGELLQEALRLESRSFLEYVKEAADPRVEPWDQEVKRALEETIAHEDAYLEEIIGLVERRGEQPDLATTFDLESSGYHYLELDYLVQVVEKKLARQLDQFRAVYDRVAELDREAGAALASVAGRKQADLARIRSLMVMAREKRGTSKIEGNVTVEPKRARRL